MTVNMPINTDLLEKLQSLAVLQNITANALAERILSDYIEDMQDYREAAAAYEDYCQLKQRRSLPGIWSEMIRCKLR